MTCTKDIGSSEGSVSPTQQVSMVSSCMMCCLIHFCIGGLQWSPRKGRGAPYTQQFLLVFSLAVGLFRTDENASSSNFKGTETGGLQWRSHKGRGASYAQQFLLVFSFAVGLFNTDETASSSNFKGTETGGLQWRRHKGRDAPYTQQFLLVFSLAVGSFSTDDTAASSNFKGTGTGGLQWRPRKGRGAPYTQQFLLVFSLAVGRFSMDETASSSNFKGTETGGLQWRPCKGRGAPYIQNSYLCSPLQLDTSAQKRPLDSPHPPRKKVPWWLNIIAQKSLVNLVLSFQWEPAFKGSRQLAWYLRGVKKTEGQVVWRWHSIIPNSYLTFPSVWLFTTQKSPAVWGRHPKPQQLHSPSSHPWQSRWVGGCFDQIWLDIQCPPLSLTFTSHLLSRPITHSLSIVLTQYALILIGFTSCLIVTQWAQKRWATLWIFFTVKCARIL